MDRARRTIFVVVARAATPTAPGAITSVDDLQRHGGPASDAVVVGVEAARRQLKALTAGASAIRLPRAVEATLEELLVDRAVVDAGAARPLPIVLPAVTGAALPAVELRRSEH